MPCDRSEGWEAVAPQFVATRSTVGAALVQSWARSTLPASGSIVDVGCGSGVPIAQALIEADFDVAGVDASPTPVAAFHRRFPDAPVRCEAAQDSAFFRRKFDGAVCIGLLFLLAEADRRIVMRRMADALVPGGRLLFSAPRQACEWSDSLTGRRSQSLGAEAYAQLLATCGLELLGCRYDEGENHYLDAVRVR